MMLYLISCGGRLAPFDIKEVRDLMMDDELELDKLGDRKTVLFCIVSDTDTISNYLCVLFLGDKKQGTLREISAMLVKESIDTYNTSDTRGTQRSYGLNY